MSDDLRPLFHASEACFVGNSDGLRARVDVELREDPLQVARHRLRAIARRSATSVPSGRSRRGQQFAGAELLWVEQAGAPAPAWLHSAALLAFAKPDMTGLSQPPFLEEDRILERPELAGHRVGRPLPAKVSTDLLYIATQPTILGPQIVT